MNLKTITLSIDLDENEAWEFSQFLKRAGFSTYREFAESEDQAYCMVGVGEKIRKALAEKGFAPR